MAWTYLFLAGIAEIVWASALKQTDGFTKLGPSLITAVFYVISIYVLSLALRSISLGVGYAVWTGIGVVGVAGVGILLYGESIDTRQLICISMIVLGIIGLQLSSS